MNRIAKILYIASYLSEPQYSYKTNGEQILLVTKSHDKSSLLPLKEKAIELGGKSLYSPKKLPKAYRGMWFEMPSETEAEALGFALRNEFKAKPMKHI